MHALTSLRPILLSISAAFFAAGMFASAHAQPKSYPRSYANIIEAARDEGKLTIYSTTDQNEVATLLALFKEQYPFLEIEYHELGSRDLYQQVLNDAKTDKRAGDLAWSSAMDLQIKLVNDGYAQSYASPEKPYLPAWAIWKNEAYGVTAEPVVFAYNTNLIAPEQAPQSHMQLTRMLRSNSALYKGKVATFDPALSGAGYLILTQDYQATLKWTSTNIAATCWRASHRAKMHSPIMSLDPTPWRGATRSLNSASSCRTTTRLWCRASR